MALRSKNKKIFLVEKDIDKKLCKKIKKLKGKYFKVELDQYISFATHILEKTIRPTIRVLCALAAGIKNFLFFLLFLSFRSR